MPTISVIVPIYNVEQYLKSCIDSILAQSFRDFELILVDDGSPDRCGEICDEYKKHDDRIIVIHKENGGLSDARNKGIDIAKGQYLSFIDSDDVINPSMLKTLYENAIRFDADISACRYCRFEDDVPVDIPTDNSNIKTFNTREKIFTDYFSRPSNLLLTSCNKIYKRTLLANCRFRKMHTWEDVEFAAQLITNNRCNKAVLTFDTLYYYRDRKMSISNTAPSLSIKLRSFEFQNYIFSKIPVRDRSYKGVLIDFFVDSILFQVRGQPIDTITKHEKITIQIILIKWVFLGYVNRFLKSKQFHRYISEIINL